MTPEQAAAAKAQSATFSRAMATAVQSDEPGQTVGNVLRQAWPQVDLASYIPASPSPTSSQPANALGRSVHCGACRMLSNTILL